MPKSVEELPAVEKTPEEERLEAQIEEIKLQMEKADKDGDDELRKKLEKQLKFMENQLMEEGLKSDTT